MRMLAAKEAIAVLVFFVCSSAAGFEIAIDATALSTSLFIIPGQTGPLPSDSTQLLDLPQGTYNIQVGSGSLLVGPFDFDVTSAGTIDFDAEFESFLSGRGTSALTINGHYVNVDATALSSTLFALPSTFGLNTPIDATVTQPLTLIPATYGFLVGSGQVATFRWTIAINGAIEYDAEFDDFLGGRGSDTLVVNGHSVRVDARGLSGTAIAIASTFGLNLPIDSSTIIPLNLVPIGGGYLFQVGSANIGLFRWNISLGGMIEYDVDFDDFLSGRGTDTLEVIGYDIFIDATALGPGSLRIFNIYGDPARDPTVVHRMRLIPTPSYSFLFRDPTETCSFQFFVLIDGTLDYDPSLDSCVSGRGTNTLTVGCKVPVELQYFSVE